MNLPSQRLWLSALLGSMVLSGCGDGSDGSQGPQGPKGDPGEPATPPTAVVTRAQSVASLDTQVDLDDLQILPGQPLAVGFSLEARHTGVLLPFSGLSAVTLYLASYQPNTSEPIVGAPNLWVSHTQFNEAGNGLLCGLEGKAQNVEGESIDTPCVLTESVTEPGHYQLSWTGEGAAPVIMAEDDGTAIHRVLLQYHDLMDAEGLPLEGRALSNPIDVLPATGALAEFPSSVSNQACIRCHNPDERFEGDISKVLNWKTHSNFQQVENCVQCHTQAVGGGEEDPTIGWNADFAPMIHRLHAGYDNYKLLTGDAKEKLNWDMVFFPGEIKECTRCHDSGDSYKTTPTMDNCESCHMSDKAEFSEVFEHSTVSNDEPCTLCHTPDKIDSVHKVGARAEAYKKLKIEITKVDYQEDVGAPDPLIGGNKDRINLTLKVTINGQPVEDGFDFADYTPFYYKGYGDWVSKLSMGIVDDNGIVTRASEGFNIAGNTQIGDIELRGLKAKDGLIHASRESTLNFSGKTFYVLSRLALCTKDGEIEKCESSNDVPTRKTTNGPGIIDGVAVDMKTYYFDQSNPNDGIGYSQETANIARQSIPERMTVNPSKCQSCHDNLPIGKTYGMTRFDQCMDCHNNTWGNSGHPSVTRETHTDFPEGTHPLLDGLPMATRPDDSLGYANRDLATIIHRRHNGIWDRNPDWAALPEVHRDMEGNLHSFPALENRCVTCHEEDKPMFAADGGLTSGRRSIAVGLGQALGGVGYNPIMMDDNSFVRQLPEDISRQVFNMKNIWQGYISPTAEACRSCHAHRDKAALAHFKANGAVVADFDVLKEGRDDDLNLLPLVDADGDAVLKPLFLGPGLTFPVMNPEYDPYTPEGISSTPDLPVESCGTCHAEGKQFGVDKVHQ